jgi:hypothetical protein
MDFDLSEPLIKFRDEWKHDSFAHLEKADRFWKVYKTAISEQEKAKQKSFELLDKIGLLEV